MIKTVEDAEKYLGSLPVIRADYSDRLTFVKAVLEALGNPQDAIPAIHIAGTSGKGSTAYYSASLLHEMGYNVGLAVSPHVNTVTERSQVNGLPLEETEYCRYFNAFLALLAEQTFTVSYIEFLTIFTYWLFAHLELDYIVIEVGLGGRLDPTNVLAREDTVRVITDIGFDHMDMLGNTLRDIAREKAGIIHAHNHVITHLQKPDVMKEITLAAQRTHAAVTVVPEATAINAALPPFQQRNFNLALHAVNTRLALDDCFEVSVEAVENSLAINIPGRFEVFTQDQAQIILDVAHNPQKIQALLNGLEKLYPNRRALFIVAFGKNKRATLKESLELLLPISERLIATEFTSDIDAERGAMSPEVVAETALTSGYNHSYVEIAHNPYEALASSIRQAKQSGALIVVTGSFYLIDGIRKALMRRPEKMHK